MNIENTQDTPDDNAGARPLGFWLRTVDALINREFAAAFDGEGATRRDWMLLNAVSGDVNVPGFADRVARKGGKRLRGLEQRGWVEESGDGTWILTEEGAAAKERLGGIVDDIRSRVSGAVSPEDFATTLASLEAIARELGWDESDSSSWPGFGGGFGPGRGFGPRLGTGHPPRLRCRGLRSRHPSRFRPEPPQGLPSRIRSGRRPHGHARHRRALRAPRPRRLPPGRPPRPRSPRSRAPRTPRPR